MVDKIKDECIVFDFDGTIADYSKREFLRDKDWDAYIAASFTDTPSKPVLEIINRFKDSYNIVILSARSEKSRAETLEWLTKYDIHHDALILKPDSATEEDCDIKSSLIQLIPEIYGKVFFCIDDRSSCVKSFRGLGLYTFQCGEGY